MAAIYFSGSITGGREDVGLYRVFVDALRSAGHRVLAGSVTDATVHAGGDDLSARAIFDRDLGWLQEVAEANGLLVAEVSIPSHGVGYEIAAARYRYGMRVICLYRAAYTRRCSAMLAGDPEIEVIEYTDESVEEAVARLLELAGDPRE